VVVVVMVVVGAELKNLNLTYFCHLTIVSFVQKLVSCFCIFYLFLSFIIPYLVGLCVFCIEFCTEYPYIMSIYVMEFHLCRT